MSDILDLIKSRRSVRHFTERVPADDVIDSVLEAGRWAPSGLNNQPWSFAVIRKNDKKEALAPLTHYGHIVTSAPVLIAVFLDNGKTYDRTKDCQAVGACIQNMLLCIHSLGLGAVWLGEILRSGDMVTEVLGAPAGLELMAVVAMGYPSEAEKGKGRRRPISESVFYKD